MRIFAGLLIAIVSAGCGGMVVFGADGDDDGAGGSTGADCVLGVCGEACTKCSGDACFNGSCDEDGRCVPPSSPVVCTDE